MGPFMPAIPRVPLKGGPSCQWARWWSREGAKGFVLGVSVASRATAGEGNGHVAGSQVGVGDVAGSKVG